MNERIRQLAEQAGIEFTYDPTETPMRAFAECWEDELAKFALLIVRECSKVISHGGQRKGAFGNEDLRPSEIATMIEEHFGVEE
jgi:hypothetical protein